MDTLNQYLQQASGTKITDATATITDMIFQWLVIPSIVLMVLIVVVYIMRAVRRHRVENAIFEIRDLLKSTPHPGLTPPLTVEPAHDDPKQDS